MRRTQGGRLGGSTCVRVDGCVITDHPPARSTCAQERKDERGLTAGEAGSRRIAGRNLVKSLTRDGWWALPHASGSCTGSPVSLLFPTERSAMVLNLGRSNLSAARTRIRTLALTRTLARILTLT